MKLKEITEEHYNMFFMYCVVLKIRAGCGNQLVPENAADYYRLDIGIIV